MFNRRNIWNIRRVLSESRKYELNKISEYLSSMSNRLKKQIKADKSEYPYELIDAQALPEPVFGIDKFLLVGENWRDSGAKKPIALLVGVNDWKYGFIADYLPEYRCAFAPMKKGWWFFARSLLKMSEKPQTVFIWGYKEPLFLLNVLKSHSIPFVRVEDGFVRSAELGAAHTTPYSLVFDRSGGLYYDPSQPSDLEDILNYREFHAHPKLLEQAEEVLALLQRLNLSKYNPPIMTPNDPFAVLTGRRRVAVIGQVENDMSLRKGNAAGWHIEDVIRLAAFENPGCEIIYRPHPEVYKGIQRSKIEAAKIQNICSISSPEEGLAQFLDRVDHVYVITSLSGLEALIRGKKVTVLGRPFYAGWGLTDDRVQIDRRKRSLSLTELFAGAYLLYPRYLGTLGNSYIGLVAACRRIVADRIIATQKRHKQIINQLPGKEELSETIRSEYWPVLLFLKSGQAHDHFDEIIYQAPFHRSFKNPECRIYQATLLHAVCGALKTDRARDIFLKKIRDFIEPSVYADFLTRLINIYPGNICILQWSWLLERLEDVPKSFDLIQAEIRHVAREAQKVSLEGDEKIVGPQNTTLDPVQKKLLYELLEKRLEHNDYKEALDNVYTLLLNGEVHTGLLLPIIKIAEQTFDVTSARLVADMLKHANITGHNNAGVNYLVECMSTTPDVESLEILLETFSLQLVLNPDRVNRTLARLNDFLGRAQAAAISEAILAMDGSQTVRMANAWLELNRPDKAYRIAKNLIENRERSDAALVAYSRALAACGDYPGAIRFMEQAVIHSPSKINYTELLRLLKAMGRFEEAHRHYRDALTYQVDLPLEGPVMPIYFGLKRIEEGFRCFLDSAMRNLLITSFGIEKYQDSEQLEIRNLLLICDFGPAEEIRYSMLLPELGEAFGYDTFKFCCDPRLLTLFERSFPQVQFTPVRRTREFDADFPHSEFNRLPSADLRRALDNNGLEAVERAEKIMLFTETFWHFRKDYGDFRRSPYLVPNAGKADTYRKCMPRNTLLVGISWRSQLTNAMRNVHYLTVQQLEPLFKIEGVTYVNLQYDDCAEELEWIRQRYPGKIINFDEIDQFNDFDSVAALMSTLDLVVGPCTAVIELAGAIGQSGLLFSNHGEMWWREIDDQGSDIWYKSIRHVRGELGNKPSIVYALVHELEHLVKSNRHREMGAAE